MRILVDILHPKQAHFYRPLIERWRARGDAVLITTRDKDITHELLDRFGLDYRCLSIQSTGWRAGRELLARWLGIARLMRSFRPDLAISVTGISTAPASRLLGIPNLAVTDTETATLSNRLALPFADRVLTPAWFRGNFGERHHRFHSFLEWSYLHPDSFTPDRAAVRAEGIDPDQPYAVARFVRWAAVHDRHEAGLTPGEAVKLVRGLARHLRVYLTSEAPPPVELRPYLTRLRVDRIHHVMAFARLVVGESPSMATEAALLGVPAVLGSSWAGRCGNMQVLEQKFGLMQVFQRGQDAVDAALRLAESPPSMQEMARRRSLLVRDLECIPDVMDRHMRDLGVGRFNG